MTKEKREFKKLNISRKKILQNFMVELFCGAIMGFACAKAIGSVIGDDDGLYTICILIFIAMCILLWMPIFVANAQIYDINEKSVKVIPKLSVIKKWKMIFHILLNDDIEPFLNVIPLTSIRYGTFHVDRHAGTWAMSRYSYMLTLYYDAKDHITLYINPMENGILMPSGKGGYLFTGCQSRKDICNLVHFFEMNQITIEDQFHIVDALKNPDIVIYDYLESLNIKVRY